MNRKNRFADSAGPQPGDGAASARADGKRTPAPEFTWDESLAVGVKEIDDQHREIIRLVSELAAAMRAGQGQDEIRNLMVFLNDYIVEHFGYEEIYMKKYRYPAYRDHKREHLNFIQEFAALKYAYQPGDASRAFAGQLQERLVRWLQEHVGSVDRKMAEFLKDRIRRSHPPRKPGIFQGNHRFP